MKNESYFLIKRKYDFGVYSLEDMCKLVENRIINEDQFHFITTYSYQGIKKERD